MKTKELTLSAIVLAIIIVLGFVPGVPLGFIPVPIALQNVGIMLAGVILGRRWGFLTVLGFLLLAALGLPVLTGGNGGFAHFMGPTAGYLIAYPVAAGLIGWATEMLRARQQLNFATLLVTILIFGLVLIDVLGAIGLTIVTHMSLGKALLSQLAFVPGDAAKAVIAAFVGTVLQTRKLTL